MLDAAARQKARRERRAKRRALQTSDATKVVAREARRARRNERRVRQASARRRILSAPQTPAEVDAALKAMGFDPAAVGSRMADAARAALYTDLSRPEAKMRAGVLAELSDQICIIFRTNPGKEPARYRIMPGDDASPGQCAQAVELVELGFGKSIVEKVPVSMAAIAKVLLLCQKQGIDPRLCELARQYLQEREADGD